VTDLQGAEEPQRDKHDQHQVNSTTETGSAVRLYP
jgi:hypothetical protein